MLLDRVPEKQALDRLLAGVRGGLSGSIVLRGEAGIGKSSLLEYAVASAGDMRVAGVADARSDRHGGVCRARSARVAGDRREGA
jgi:predicted ATP-dependent serine protease